VPPKYCYIQLTPLPKVPSNETEKERDDRLIWVRSEVAAFKSWSSTKEEGTTNIASGFPTKFLIQCSYNPQESEDSWDKALDYFIQDIFAACVYGDRGATLDGQSFNKRARWRKKIRGNWNWKSKVGIKLSDGRTLNKVAEYPSRPKSESTPLDLWSKVLLLSVILVPIMAVLAVTLAK